MNDEQSVFEVGTSLPQACIRGGLVKVGCKLMTAEGRLLLDALGRTFWAHDVAAGDAVTVSMTIPRPPDLSAGAYHLLSDLIDEQICWFSDLLPESAVVKTVVIR